MRTGDKMRLIYVSHGGHSGDIIYSLPLVKYLALTNNAKIVYCIISDQPNVLPLGMKHPNGNATTMNYNAFAFIKPLISNQSYTHDVKFVERKTLPKNTFCLDFFRSGKLGMRCQSGNISQWARKAFGFSINTEQKWLEIDKSESNGNILCSLSSRYRNTKIDYRFLNNYKCDFIGTDEEYNEFKKAYSLLNLNRIFVRDALEAAKELMKCKLFIGNQSFMFSIAEGLKINRALEVCEICPNVIPSGDGAHDFLNQYALKNTMAANGIYIESSENPFSHNYTLQV